MSCQRVKINHKFKILLSYWSKFELNFFLSTDMMRKDGFKLAISLVAQETNVKLRNLKLKKSSSLVFFSHDLTCAHVKIRFTIIWPVAVQCAAAAAAAAAAVAAAVVAVRWRRRRWQRHEWRRQRRWWQRRRRHGSNRRCLGSRTSALYYARLKRVYCREN